MFAKKKSGPKSATAPFDQQREKGLTIVEFVGRMKQTAGDGYLAAALSELRRMYCGDASLNPKKGGPCSLNWRDISLKSLTLEQLGRLLNSADGYATIRLGWFGRKAVISRFFRVYHRKKK
ncbi:MAG: hypothetical protein AAB358_03725 [Patescibacteria group bacterium]